MRNGALLVNALSHSFVRNFSPRHTTECLLFCMSRLLFRFCVLSIVFVATATATAGLKFTTFRSLSGQRYSEPTDLSSNGWFVVGMANDRSETQRAVMGEGRRRLIDLGSLAGLGGDAWGVSTDGRVVVGCAYNAAGARRAFRWTTNGMQDLDLNQDWESVARGVSSDGNVVVGWLALTNGFERPFRWTAAGGTVELGTLGASRGFANGANRDGRVVVGAASLGGDVLRACRWVAQGEAQPLGELGEGESQAYAVTADGSVIVGAVGVGESNSHAFRWTAASGMVSLHPEDLPFVSSTATDISADGTRIVGVVVTENLEEHGALWTPHAGLQDMNVLFRKALPRGWTFVRATAISADGRWIAGTVRSPKKGIKGYVLDTGAVRQ